MFFHKPCVMSGLQSAVEKLSVGFKQQSIIALSERIQKQQTLDELARFLEFFAEGLQQRTLYEKRPSYADERSEGKIFFGFSNPKLTNLWNPMPFVSLRISNESDHSELKLFVRRAGFTGYIHQTNETLDMIDTVLKFLSQHAGPNKWTLYSVLSELEEHFPILKARSVLTEDSFPSIEDDQCLGF